MLKSIDHGVTKIVKSVALQEDARTGETGPVILSLEGEPVSCWSLDVDISPCAGNDPAPLLASLSTSEQH